MDGDVKYAPIGVLIGLWKNLCLIPPYQIPKIPNNEVMSSYISFMLANS